MVERVCTYCGQAGHRAHACPKRPRERDIAKYLLARVAALGGEARKVRWEGRANAPDWRVMLADRRFWAELKAPGERPTAMQVREHNRMRRLGEVVHVLDSAAAVDKVLS